MVRSHGTQCLDRRWSTLKKYIPKEFWRPNIQVIETWIRKSETIYCIYCIQICLEMQCAEGCSVETTWHLGKDLQMKKQQALSLLNIWKGKKHSSTNLKSSKQFRRHANTIRNASLHKMLWTQNPGRVVETITWQQKKWKSPGCGRHDFAFKLAIHSVRAMCNGWRQALLKRDFVPQSHIIGNNYPLVM